MLLRWFVGGHEDCPNLSMYSSKRFFRARAGSPTVRKLASAAPAVLPRTRGFTGQRDGMVRALRGSSAHARVQAS
jgi:hypothetical protein